MFHPTILKYTYATLLILLCLTGFAFGNKYDRAFRSLERNEYEKAYELFSELIREDPKSPAAYFGMAAVFSNDDYRKKDVPRAYKYIRTSLDLFLSDQNNKEIQRLNLKEADIRRVKERIETTLLHQSRDLGSLQDFIDFINKNDLESLMELETQSERDHIGFILAEKENSIEAYNLYLKEFAASDEVEIAKALRNKIAFENAIDANTIEAFNDFIAKYPDAVEVDKAINLRNKLIHTDSLEKDKTYMASEIENQSKQITKQEKELIQEKEQKKALRNNFIIAGIAFLIIGGLIFISYRNQRKANRYIMDKNRIIEEKNDQLMESIRYAKYIQEALLPPKKLFDKNFKDSFILFIPKDVVSGDFYWSKRAHGYHFIAAADCTGHGVPGAFMSMIGSTLLTEIVIQNKTIDPAQVLDELRSRLIAIISQNDREDANDGMDVGLCRINHDTKEIVYAGAYNKMYVTHKNTLDEYKGDRMPVGRHYTKTGKSFTQQTIPYIDGGKYYLFSDGFPDQLGGPDDKKYSTKKFKEKLKSIYPLDADSRRSLLAEDFRNWKHKNEQTDDILIMSFTL